MEEPRLLCDLGTGSQLISIFFQRNLSLWKISNNSGLHLGQASAFKPAKTLSRFCFKGTEE